MSQNKNIQLENLEIYKHIVNHMTESLWIWDEENNTIYTNNVFCDITWYTQEEIIWENYSKFWQEKDIDENIKKWKKIKYEANIKTKKWKLIPVLCSWSIIENGWTVLTISDLSELKSLKEVENNLIKINKTKDEFISIVWHELRTPLTSIRWYLSMILDWDMWDINTQVKKALNHSFDSSIRLINLVNDVLSIWRIESWKMEYYMTDLSIREILKSTYKDIHLEMEIKDINFELEIDKQLDKSIIHSDKDKLQQIFLNLLTNSLKFTKKGWKITLKASKIDNKVRFEVIDTWIWIAKEKINELFTKFSQVESSMQRENDSWLWLGLAICKNFINTFWSEIKVESELWKWSNFYFDLELK